MLLALTLLAQIELPRIAESVEVRVTSVDVVVTDKLGRRVHGLTKDDFELVDDGKPQEITNFSEIGGPQSGEAGLPPRRIVIFFDCGSTSSQERRRIVPALTRLLEDLGASDEAMVVAWNRALTVLAEPTSDRATLVAALDRASRMAGGIASRTSMFGAPMSDTPASRAQRTFYARRAVREASADLTEGVRAVNSILTRLAGVDGRKALILISSGFSLRPGAEGMDPAEADAVLWVEHVTAPEELKALTSAANSAGVTLYTLHAQGLDSGMSAAQAGPPATSLPPIQIDGLSYLAARTGGFVTANTNTFAHGVTAIAEDLSSYYSLGYRATVTRRDGERRISVRTRDRSYMVRARRTMLERSFETELAERVVSALLFPSQENQLGIRADVLRTDRRRKNRFAIPVDIHIPYASLSFIADQEVLVADVSVFIASADAAGSLSGVERFRQRIPVERARLATLAKDAFVYRMDVDLRSASTENRLAVAVLDNTSKITGLVTVTAKP